MATGQTRDLKNRTTGRIPDHGSPGLVEEGQRRAHPFGTA